MIKRITSYDVSQELKDKINNMTEDEIRELQASVKSPNQCKAGDPDLEVWWVCSAALTPDHVESEPIIDMQQLIPWLE